MEALKTQNKINPYQWVNLYADYLFNYAIMQVKSSEIAEDLVQDTFMSALKSIKNFNGKSGERTWLTSILKNKIIDHYRKKSNQCEILINERSEDYDNSDHFFETEANKRGTWTSEARPNVWNFEDRTPVENKEFYEILQSCLGKLPESWAAVFSLKNIEDFNSKEICKELNISSSNYWVIMHRSKLQLRECMEKNWMNV